MRKDEKEVLQYQLDSEKAILKELEKQYKAALEAIDEKVAALLGRNDANLQHVIFQIEHQKALRRQIEGVLNQLHSNEFDTISDYLANCYEDGFIGSMYSMHHQGIPVIVPIDQNEVTKAVVLDSKISEGLYESIGVDVDKMKKSIRSEITRGISAGMSYNEIARNISKATKAPLSRAKTIVYTEGHRVQQASNYDGQRKAKSKGADVVKQWNSILDGNTRPTHRKLDGQIREVEEPFEMDGKKAMYPGEFGDPAEDCNCRCVSMTRARWALDEDELQTLKDRAEYFGLDKSESFNDFKKKFLEASKQIPETISSKYVPAKTIKEAEDFAKQNGVKYADYSKLPLETANKLNEALSTLPEDVRPVFVGDSVTLEKYWGGKLPRSSRNYYGVTMQIFDGVHLGFGNGVDFDANGYMVGISSSYKTSAKITASKLKSQKVYQDKYGRKWFFNENGESTPFHEMGHVYANTKGLPKGFEEAAERWAKEAKCDMLKKPSEAWAEAWGAYFTGNNDLPDYISSFVKNAANTGKIASNSLIAFDDDAIINLKIKEFSDKLRSGNIRTTISPQKQSRHIYGSKEYLAYVDRLSSRGDFPAYIREDVSVKDLHGLVRDKLGTGIIEIKSDNSVQEFFDCDDTIGYYYDKTAGKYVPTKRVQVKYSIGDGNIHIIPVKEK